MGRLLYDGALRWYRVGYVWICLLQLVLEGAKESGRISEMVSLRLGVIECETHTDQTSGPPKRSTSSLWEEEL